MAIDETKEIRGQTYRLMRLDPIKGGRLAMRVAKQLAAALGDVEAIQSLLSSKEKASEPSGNGALSLLADQSKLVAALAGGVAKIDPDALYDCALECIRGRLFAEHKLHDDQAINAWFGEHPDHMLLVLAWALQVNCAGFFGLAGAD